jgi:hypothetical protein
LQVVSSCWIEAANDVILTDLHPFAQVSAERSPSNAECGNLINDARAGQPVGGAARLDRSIDACRGT